MTASNLFKYCQPCHGLVLFKRHHPLHFSLPELADLLLAAEGWFQRAAAEHPAAKHPFLLWNCGARAGASQFHGHAQVLLSKVSTILCFLLFCEMMLLHCHLIPPSSVSLLCVAGTVVHVGSSKVRSREPCSLCGSTGAAASLQGFDFGSSRVPAVSPARPGRLLRGPCTCAQGCRPAA